MVVIDASVWVSLFKTDDVFHGQADHIIESLLMDGETIGIPVIAFTEVAGVIKRSTRKNDTALKSVWDMEDMASEILANFSELEPVATQIAVNYGIKGADAYYLAVAEKTRSNLVTFDKEQQKAFEEMSKIW